MLVPNRISGARTVTPIVVCDMGCVVRRSPLGDSKNASFSAALIGLLLLVHQPEVKETIGTSIVHLSVCASDRPSVATEKNSVLLATSLTVFGDVINAWFHSERL